MSKSTYLITHQQIFVVFEILHILPFYPASSDGGFSVTDHKNVNKDLGTWNDIRLLSNHVNIMADLILNHASIKSKWFKSFIKQQEKYKSFFLQLMKILMYQR